MNDLKTGIDFSKLSIEESLKRLNVDIEQGLSQEEVDTRLKQFGPNALEEKKENLLLKFLSYFWGPIPWMIEIAAILSAAIQHWPDFFIILFLLLFNAAVGFWQEHQAANAVEALKKQLAIKVVLNVKANGWKLFLQH